MNEKVIGVGMEEAMRRFALIAPLVEDGLCASELAQRRCWLLRKEDISERTLRRWVASYKRDGFNGLIRKERKDKGSNISIPQHVLELAEQMRRELPRRSAGLIVELLERDGYKVARSTRLRRKLSTKSVVASLYRNG